MTLDRRTVGSALLALLLLFLVWGSRVTTERLSRELRNEIARADTTRRIAHGTFARKAVELRSVRVSNSSLKDKLAQAHGEVVFLAEHVRILQGEVRAPATPGVRRGRVFDWGPVDLKIATLTGEIDTNDSIPTFRPVLQPHPLILDFAVIRHENAPWEAVIHVEPYDSTTHVVFDAPPQVATFLVSAPRVCRHWYTIICDGSAVAAVGVTSHVTNQRVVAAGIYSTGIFGQPRLRAIVQVTTEPTATLLFGYRFH